MKRFMVARKMGLRNMGYKHVNRDGAEHFLYVDDLGNPLIWDEDKEKMINILIKPITRRQCEA